jgi:hypothetical protein
LRKQEASSSKLNQLIPKGTLADIRPFPERLTDEEGQPARASMTVLKQVFGERLTGIFL